KAGKIHLLKLKRRFHGQPLPVPKEKLFLRPFLRDQKINSHLTAEIIKVIQAGHPLLLFVPRINQIGPYIAALKKIPELAEIKIAGVHANDAERIAKVDQFRSGQIQLLVTTTILERGVTFNHVWVIVVQADDKIYTSSSLVQIAGRVGRAKNDPEGLVLFCYQKYTSCIRSAV
ncbi:MAG: DNA/RNA helicase, partial [Lactobacillus sp.]|nr:DNA/RNA helicase [Lactobacillus sp.]